MTDTFPCPQCGILLRRSPALHPGVLVKCPKCTHQFRVPDLESSALPSMELIDPPDEPRRRDASPAKDENPFAFEDTGGVPSAPARGNASLDFDHDDPRRRPDINLDKYDPDRPRRERPIDDEDQPRPRRRERDLDEDDDRPRRRERDLDFDEDRPHRRGRLDSLPTDHTMDIGSSYRLAWSCWGEFLGPAIGFIFVAGLIMIPVMFLAMIPLLGIVIYLIVVIPLVRGPQLVALRVVRGKEWSFNDFFGGFHYLGQLIGLAFMQGVVSAIAYVPFIIVLVAAEFVTTKGPSPNRDIIETAGGMASGVLGLVIFVYFEARFFTFALQLMVHKKLGVIDAMRGCWRLSEGHTLSFIGINLLSVLMAISGVALGCLGVLFTAPFACLFVAAAYARMMDNRTADEDSRPKRPSRREENYEENRPRPRRSSPPSRDDY